MKKLFLILVMLTVINARGQWVMQHPIPTNQTLMNIQMINSKTGYMAGYYGTLLKTTNAGVNWINLFVPTTKDLESIFFLGENTGYITGRVGLLAKTTNGGLNWTFRNYDTTKTIMSIYFKNENEGFIGAYPGGLYKTLNGGLNWTTVDTNIYMVRNIHFTSSSIGYASGSYRTISYNFYGLILKTTNGGLNWVMKQPPVTTPEYSSMKFFNDNTGYVGGENLLYTINGAATWIGISKPDGGISALYFTDFNNGYILNHYQAEPPKLYKTTNGGGTWVNLNLTIKYNYYGISGVGDSLYLAGHLGAYAHSYNGGANWVHHNVVNTSLYSIHFINKLTAWAAGERGTLLYTDNGGDTWHRNVFPDTTAFISKILFLNNNTGFIGADNGKLFRTTDSGNTWGIYLTGSIYSIEYMSFINSTTGFISTTRGEIYKTTNTGTNWNLIKNFNGAYYGDIHFFNENKGLISKSLYGVNDILMTTNGGIDWNSVFVPTCELKDFYFSDQNKGYVSGTSKIYKTTNGGLNWSLSNSFTSATMYSIYSIGDKVWACGGSGKILYSSNGGSNWQIQNSRTNQTLNSIIFLDSSVGYVCGNAGYIAKTTNSGTVFITKISNTIPSSLFLGQNYPNPFNPTTKIRFDVALDSRLRGNDKVLLKVYDIMGREVQTLVNETLKPGTYEATFDASTLNSGVYFYKLSVADPTGRNGFTETKKMLMIK